MSKSDLVKDWLDQMIDYHAKRGSTADRLYKNGFRQIADFLKREGFEKTKSWIDERLVGLAGARDTRLTSMVRHYFQQAKQKIWNIEHKGGKENG